MSNGPPSSSGHRLLRGAAAAATGFTFLLIAVGALVRATDSGLGCPGWPKCFGRWIPPFEYHAIIEYSHRLTASVVLLLVAALAVVALWRYRRVPRVVWPAVGATFLWLFQAVLGAIVVKYGLSPWLVTAHLATAMLFAGTLVYVTVASFTVEARPGGAPDRLTVAGRAVAAAVLVLILVGAYVRGEGAGLVFPDWPLMNGRIVPSAWSVPVALHFVHRILAASVGLAVVWFAVMAWRERPRRAPAARLAAAAAVLFAGQILVGAANVWSRLAGGAVVAHVLLASLIWGALVASAAAGRAVPATPPGPSFEPPEPGLTKPEAAPIGSRA